MRYRIGIGVFTLALAFAAPVAGGEPPCCEPPGGVCERIAPVGGWRPDCCGILNWWNRCCFPRCCGPDDYCRKPMPCVCWPKYPPYFSWGAPGCNQPNGACENRIRPSP